MCSKIERWTDVNNHMWKCHVSYLLILNKISYIITTDKPSRDYSAPQEVNDKWEGDNDIANAAFLSHLHDDLIALFNSAKQPKNSKSPGDKYNTLVDDIFCWSF